MNRARPRNSSVALLGLALSLLCGAGPSEPRVAPDESLTPHQYEQLGFPPLQDDWSASERSKARSVLRSLASAQPEQLPRSGSKSSGVVFDKLVDEEFNRRGDLEGAVGAAPVGQLERTDADELAHLIQGDTLEGIYAPESTGGLIFDRELVEFASRSLAGAVADRSDLQKSLAEVEASPTPGQDFAARYRELLQFNDQLLVQAIANIATFAIAERFTPAARSDATAILAEQIPHIAPLLSTEAQGTLREIIHTAAGSPRADRRLEALSGQW